MGYPPDDPAGQRAGRRRGYGSEAEADRQQDANGSGVFAPGYGSRRDSGPHRQSGGHASPAAPWQGSAASGAAGRGPVRGYPPQPGQPAPMYPPGQFAAWNRGPGAHARPAEAGPVAPDVRSAARAPGPVRGDELAGPGYFGRDSDAEPGYPMLAVSDPAADVTTTQTWRAVGDGRATGTWTAPARPGGGRPAGDQPPGGPADWPTPDRQRSGAHARPASSVPVQFRTEGTAAGAGQDDGADIVADGQRGSGGGEDDGRGAAPGSSRRGRERAQASAASPAPAAQTRGRTRKVRSQHASGVRLAITGAVVLIVGAAAALYFGAQEFSPSGHPTARPPATPTATAAASPTLGPYGHIESRQTDPMPLTIAELYPASFSAAGSAFVQTASRLSRDCIDAVTGAGLQAAISSAGCSQSARATYVDVKAGMMGTIGVLNLRTAAAAIRATRAAGPTGFITQLPGRSGPTHKIGQATGIEEAAAKGHYLILIWAGLTDLRRPRGTAQSYRLERFMTQLLENTANVSLSNRMATGTPS